MKYIGAIDQGTTSTRFILFDKNGEIAAGAQEEHRQFYPQPGWVEHDAMEILDKTAAVVRKAMQTAGITAGDLAGIGITNQRETVVVWDRQTGKPLHHALVWQDTRTAPIVAELEKEYGSPFFRRRTGLPLAAYFSGTKLLWLLRNKPEVRRAFDEKRALIGTIDSWLIWNLTGGPGQGVHVTDVSNASRTLLMDLENCRWDKELLDIFGVPAESLPSIVSSVPESPYGWTKADGPLGGSVPLCGILGDQQSAMFGQTCFDEGNCKNTYGTGCFMLMNTGEERPLSTSGLLTTALYRIGDQAVRYALEGSVAIAGSLVQWFRDNIGLIRTSEEIEALAAGVDDNGGVYFVPAFSGLFAPHWRPDARGTICGLTGFARSGHIARAILEATAFQTYEIVKAMERESGATIQELKVDGGMVANKLLMQFQSDILGAPIVKPVVAETTALGAAYAAGLSTGFWRDTEELKTHWKEDRRWQPAMPAEEREEKVRFWKKAVKRTLDWTEE